MDGRGLGRSVRAVGSMTPVWGIRTVCTAVRRRRADAAGLPPRGAERARVPGVVAEVVPGPGGGSIRFARSRLRVLVTVTGAVFWGWDGAGPEPSYALAGAVPEPDARAALEPDMDGGWRVVSERVTLVVSRLGGVRVCTPGGVVLREVAPPRWWEPVDGGAARWMERAEVAADARFFGLGGRSAGPRLPDGTYRMWNTGPRKAFGPGDDPLSLTMPVQLVVADAGTHLVFHDTTWDGSVTLQEGEEGLGSGHDRPGTVEWRSDGGPLRCWVVVGSPARVLHTWVSLTGAPAVPPTWALGHHHARQGFGSAAEVRRVVAGYRKRGVPLDAVHLGADHLDGHRVFTADPRRYPDLPGLAGELARDGVRLVSVVGPAVKAERGNAVFESGREARAFVREGGGRKAVGTSKAGASVYPDFTDPGARAWWGGWYGERLAQGFAGFWHDLDEPVSFTAFGERTLPRSARHSLEGRGGDHREAHNVYALGMARAGYEGVRRARPAERPFVFSRSGWVGLQRYGGAWSGGVVTGWPGLRASLAWVLGLGLCGVPYSGPDVGGGTDGPSAELYVRWFQLGAYLPLFRTHAALRAARREPWAFGEEALGHARAAAVERRRLVPYFGTLARVAARTGAPYVRPLWWGAPEDRKLRDCGDAFLLGDALLVAPVLDPGVVEREVQLPEGTWYDVVSGKRFTGPGRVRVAAPLSRIPVLARAGAVVPVRGEGDERELEVWPPVPGSAGGGLVVTDAGDGWESDVVERFTTRLRGGRVVVRRHGGGPVGYPVRVREVDPPPSRGAVVGQA
ncbi:glycoside hydrolase family 31 protein [Streptomyces sp. LE64]|uniref:glycoside hydrolase family 31 protein n=1 Tax=Streptomyces sp. LE64 TaxID=3448653 RepID=UPI0040421AA3